jgi:hypothetical protein
MVVLGLSSLLQAASPNSGDKELDRWLVNIDFVTLDAIAEIKKMAKRYKIQQKLLTDARDNYEFTIADLHLAGAIYAHAKIDWNIIIKAFANSRSEGVNKIFRYLSIRPKTEEYAAIKSAIKRAAPKGDPEADSRNPFKAKK